MTPWKRSAAATKTPPDKKGRDWRDGIEPISLQDLKRIGRDADNKLYWDGKQIRTTFKLTVPQQFIAVVATLASIATIFTGLNNASVFLCGRGVTLLGCPAAPAPAAPPPVATPSPAGTPSVRLGP